MFVRFFAVHEHTERCCNVGYRWRCERCSDDSESSCWCWNIRRWRTSSGLCFRLLHRAVQISEKAFVGSRRLELLANVQSDSVQFLQEHLPLRHRTLVCYLLRWYFIDSNCRLFKWLNRYSICRLVGTDFVRTMDDWIVQRVLHRPSTFRDWNLWQGLFSRNALQVR